MIRLLDESDKSALETKIENLEDQIGNQVDELKGDLDDLNNAFIIEEIYSLNRLDNDNAVVSGNIVKIPVYLTNGKTYQFGRALSSGDNVGFDLILTDENETVSYNLGLKYHQLPNTGVSFTSELDGKCTLKLTFITGGITQWKEYMVIENDNKISWHSQDFVKFNLKINYHAKNANTAEQANTAKNANRIISRYFNKIHLSFGDSITAQQTWQGYFKTYLGTIQEIVKGYPGSALYANCTTEAIESRIGSETFDFLTVMFGTNDWAQSREIGNNTDTNENGIYQGTFKGSLNTFCKNITTLYPNKPIILVTPPNAFINTFTDNGSKNELGFTIKNYADAIKEICALWGIPCFDFNSVCGWNYMNKSTYLKDDGNYIHPNDTGGKEYAYKLAKYCELN